MDRYRLDSFFRTECNIILLLIAFSVVIITLFSLSSNYLYENISIGLVEGIQQSITSQADPSIKGTLILDELEYIRSQNLAYVLAASIAVTVLFGFLMAKVTLSPARDALESQRQFIASIAHELRTPLAIVKADTEVALFDNNLDPELRHMLESNIDEFARISDIINNLLTLNAFVRSEYIAFGPVDLAKVITDVSDKLKHLQDQRELMLAIDSPQSVMVWGNATALEQIVTNIMKNAIKYTPVKGTIAVRLRELSHNKHAELTIEDSGIGIESRELAKIFEPFYRSHGKKARKRSGSGLGLAIVSELVRLHYGRITIASKIGQGTAVRVVLPQEQERHSEPARTSEHIHNNEVTVDFSDSRA